MTVRKNSPSSRIGNLQQWYDPIDTTNPRLIKLAKELGTAWVRVSGTWVNKTYYDFNGKCGGKAPEGFQNVLTKQQWLSLLDGLPLYISIMATKKKQKAGDHDNLVKNLLISSPSFFAFSPERKINPKPHPESVPLYFLFPSARAALDAENYPFAHK